MLNKLELFLFYFLLFTIPFQTRKILWHQNWNFNEWQAMSIYGTDLLLLILFGFWIFSRVKPRVETYDYFLFALVAISAISIKNSTSPILSAYNVLKLIEFVAFYFYLKSYAIYKFGLTRSMMILIAGGLFQAIIAIFQFLKQSSLGLRLFGESILAPNLTGVASFYNLFGEKIMRAYGTTPHPNILATYLFLAIFAFYYLWIYKNISRLYLFVYGLILLAFFFTFARVAILLLFVNFVARIILVRLRFSKEYWNKKLALLFLTTIIISSFFSLAYWPDVASRIKIYSNEEAVQLRVFYNKESLKSPNWFGVGSGNFVNWLMVKDPNLPRNIYQPVHNIYLLIYSETGILGISAFLMFLALLVKNFIVRTKMSARGGSQPEADQPLAGAKSSGGKNLYNYSFLLIFLSILFIGLFDHFLWTLQQGRLIFWLSVALLTPPLKTENEDR